jgi:hypothetical protein
VTVFGNRVVATPELPDTIYGNALGTRETFFVSQRETFHIFPARNLPGAESFSSFECEALKGYSDRNSGIARAKISVFSARDLFGTFCFLVAFESESKRLGSDPYHYFWPQDSI